MQSGAISLLLQLQRRMKDDVSQAILRESLALVGYSPPLPKKGIRILCIDGGGIRYFKFCNFIVFVCVIILRHSVCTFKSTL